MKQFKKIMVGIVALAVVLSLSITAKAQSGYQPGQVSLNAGMSYGLDLEKAGLRLGVSYFMTEKIRLGADFTYWLIEDSNFEFFDVPVSTESTAYEININLHYLFYEQNGLVLYGAGALGYHHAKASISSGSVSDSVSDGEIGIGIGGGVEYNMGKMAVFAEPKVFFSGFDQVKLNFGLRFNL